MGNFKRIVVVDTETTGLDADYNVILSLSWQVLDGNLNKIAEESRFFDWPKDRSRVERGAIEVNGLTEERRAELGTCDKKAALQEFYKVVAGADLLVAHNMSFDARFIVEDASEFDLEFGFKIKFHRTPRFDTMTDMTNYCRIPRGNGEYKWPRLYELAYCLGVDTEDIDWHQSASDVEVTARCFRKIVEKGMI